MTNYLTEPATIFEIFKFLIPFLLAFVAWCFRVEKAIARHDLTLDRISKTLEHIDHTLQDLDNSKEIKAERLAKIEAKLDFMMSQAAIAAAQAPFIPPLTR